MRKKEKREKKKKPVNGTIIYQYNYRLTVNCVDCIDILCTVYSYKLTKSS